jgi:large subunit ribosomal protein L25
LQHIVHKIKLTCLPKDIPEKIDVDVSGLGINQFIHIRDLTVPNVVLMDNGDISLVGVMPPTVIKEPEPAVVAVEAQKEPEVVGKAKKPEEGAEGGAEAPKAESKEKK